MSDAVAEKNEKNTDALDPFAGITDGRLAVEPEAATGFGEIVEKYAKSARTAEITATNAKKRLAWASSWGSTYVEKPNGGPDWASETSAYAIVVTNAIVRGLGNLAVEDATKIRNAVRQHGTRWATLRAVVLYVALTGNTFGEMAAKLADVRADWTLGLDSSELDDFVKVPPSDAFILAVQREYARARSTDRGGKFQGLPPSDSAYAVKTTDGTGTGTPPPKFNPAETLKSSVSAVAKVTPLTTAETLRDMTRAFVRYVTAEGFKFEGGTRAKIAAVLTETHPMLILTAKMVEAKSGQEITEAELNRLVEWASDAKPAPTT